MRSVATIPNIGQILLNAQVFKLAARNHAELMNFESIPQLVENLFSMLVKRPVDFVLVGGLALLQHVQGRNTEDIDLILAGPSLRDLPELVVKGGEGFFRLASYEGLRVDLLLSENPLFQLVCDQHAETRLILGHSIRCATPSGLVLMKLYALPSLYSQGDFGRVSLYEGDISNLLFQHPCDVPSLLTELKKHLPATDHLEVTKITAEIEAKIARFKRR